MRILLLTHAFNSLTQRLSCRTRARGHDVSVELDVHHDLTRQGIALFAPDVVIATFLKRAIPEDIWRSVRCLIVHPGIPGDRGPSALDWAILEAREAWGVTVLEADAELDAGPVWASASFVMRDAAKSSLYRREVTDAAVSAVVEALARIGRMRRRRGCAPTIHGFACAAVARSATAPSTGAATTAKPCCARSAAPTVRRASPIHVRRAVRLVRRPSRAMICAAEPGSVWRNATGALARATVDGAVWIGHVRKIAGAALKLPAADVFADAGRRTAACRPQRLSADPV